MYFDYTCLVIAFENRLNNYIVDAVKNEPITFVSYWVIIYNKIFLR